MNEGQRAPRLDLALALGLFALVLGLYARSAGHEFLSYDDGAYVTENPHVAGGLTRANLAWAWLETHSANWHPLTWMSHQLDVELFGLDPGPPHLVNAALHGLNALLAFLFFRRATGRRWASLLVALLFALHPLRVQSVAWVSERKDVLAGLFFFLALHAYLGHARAPTRARLGLVVLAFALGLLAKPMLVTLPCVLLVLDLWPLGRLSLASASGAASEPRARLLREKLPLFVLAAASAAITLGAQRAGGAVQSIEVLSLAERAATALQGTCLYLGKTLWPAGLAFFYPHPALVAPDFAPLGAATALAALFLVGVSAALWRLRARQPVWLAGWAWMLLMLLPVVGLVQVGAQFYADRYTYLPLLGPLFAVVFGLEAALGARARRAGWVLGLLLAGVCAALSVRQIDTWRDMRTLCARALAVTERNYVAHEHLGLWLQRKGELAGAQCEYEAALAITPLPSSLSNLATIHAHLGRDAEARAAFEEALRRQPDFLKGRLAYGLFFERAGELARAAEQYEFAARQHPEAVAPWLKLGDVQRAAGRPADARTAYARARALGEQGDAGSGVGSLLELELGLAECARALGEGPTALAHYEAAGRSAPLDPRPVLGRAWLHATSADGRVRAPARALALLEEPARRGGAPSWQQLRTLAAALAASGRSDEAVRAAAEASALAPPEEWPTLKAERELYAAGRALER